MNEGHDIREATVLARENFWLRKISEVIKIKEGLPMVNRDSGFNLPATFTELLSCDQQHTDQITSIPTLKKVSR